MTEEKKRISMRPFSVILGVLIFIIVMTGVSGGGYLIARKTFINELNEKNEFKVNQIQNEISNILDKKITLIRGIAFNYETFNLKDAKNIEDILNKSVTDDIHSLYIGLESGEMISSNSGVAPSNHNMKSEDWYVNGRNNELFISSPYLDTVKNDVMVTMSIPLKLQGNIVGVVGADIKINSILEVINEVKENEENYSFILDANNNVITHIDKEFLPTKDKLFNIQDMGLDALLNAINEGNSGNIIAEDFDGTDKIFIFEKLNNESNWTLVSVEPKYGYRENLSTLIFGVIITGILGTIIGSLLIYSGVNILIKEIEKTKDRLIKINNHDYTETIGYLGFSKEVVELNTSYNNMVDAQKELVLTIKNNIAKLHKENDVVKNKVQRSKDSGDEILQSVNSITRAVEEQAYEMSDILEKMNALAVAIDEIEVGSTKLTNSSTNVKEKNYRSEILMSDIREFTVNNLESVNGLSKEMQELVREFSTIGTIAETIGEISDKTNLLALNAAIEAAAAGEYGRGFSVVADEVRALAEQSNNSVKLIQSIVSKVQKSVNIFNDNLKGTVQIAVESEEKIESIITEQAVIKESIDELIVEIQAITGEIDTVNKNKDEVYSKLENAAGLAEEQNAAIEEINANLQHQTENINDINESMKDIGKLEVELSETVEIFKIKQ